MGEEGDFASYLVARWPALVRAVVLLGCPPAEADALARETLARCHPDFDRARREGDLDVHVYQRLHEVWRRHVRRTGGGTGSRVGHAAVLDPTVTDPERRVALLAALEEALGGMSEEQRLVVVLRFVAELDQQQVADALGLPPAEVAARQAEALAHLRPDVLAREHL